MAGYSFDREDAAQKNIDKYDSDGLNPWRQMARKQTGDSDEVSAKDADELLKPPKTQKSMSLWDLLFGK